MLILHEEYRLPVTGQVEKALRTAYGEMMAALVEAGVEGHPMHVELHVEARAVLGRADA